jgi:hypothetical protein
MSIMTNQAYNGFSVAKLAEQAVSYGNYITHMWTSSNLEGKITLSGAVGVVSWCSYLLCRRMTLTPVETQQSIERVSEVDQLEENKIKEASINLLTHLNNMITIARTINGQPADKNRICESS